MQAYVFAMCLQCKCNASSVITSTSRWSVWLALRCYISCRCRQYIFTTWHHGKT